MEIFTNLDFQRFVWMNFFCVCRSTMHMNFAAMFTERLIPETYLPLGSWRISFFYGFCAVFPQVSLEIWFVFSSNRAKKEFFFLDNSDFRKLISK